MVILIILLVLSIIVYTINSVVLVCDILFERKIAMSKEPDKINIGKRIEKKLNSISSRLKLIYIIELISIILIASSMLVLRLKYEMLVINESIIKITRNFNLIVGIVIIIIGIKHTYKLMKLKKAKEYKSAIVEIFNYLPVFIIITIIMVIPELIIIISRI